MAAHQAPPSLGFSRQEHWTGLPFPSPMHESEKRSRSVVFDSSRPHGLQPTRLLRPWDFPDKSTGVGCHCLLPRMLVTPKGNIQHLKSQVLNFYFKNCHHWFNFLLKGMILICSCKVGQLIKGRIWHRVEIAFDSATNTFSRVQLFGTPWTVGEGGDREWDGWMASLSQWTGVSVNSGRQWRAGKPDVLQFMGS